MKVTLTGVWHNATNKAGVAYKNKDGKPYERCSIKVAEHGDKYLSGFGNSTTKAWAVGDEIDIVVEEKGDFLNFSLPKKEQGGMSEQDKENIRAIREVLHIHGFQLAKIIEILEGKSENKVPYPSPEDEGIDVSRSGEENINPADIPF